MSSIATTFPITPNAFDLFVQSAQQHIRALQKEAAPTNALGQLIITFNIQTLNHPSGIEYLVEYEGRLEIRTVKPRWEERGFRQNWRFDRGEAVDQYDFQHERQRIASAIEGKASYNVTCSIIGYTFSGKLLRI